MAGNYFNRPIFRYRGADVLNLLNLCSVSPHVRKRLLHGGDVSIASAAFTEGHVAVCLAVEGRAGYVLLVFDDVPAALHSARSGLEKAMTFLQSLCRTGSAAGPPHPHMLFATNERCGIRHTAFFRFAGANSVRPAMICLLSVDAIGDTDIWYYDEVNSTWTVLSSFSLNFMCKPLSSHFVQKVVLEETALSLLWCVSAGQNNAFVRVLSTSFSLGEGGEVVASPPAELVRNEHVVSINWYTGGFWVACIDSIYNYNSVLGILTSESIEYGRILAADTIRQSCSPNTLLLVTDAGALVACELREGLLQFQEIVRFSCSLSPQDVPGMHIWQNYMLFWCNGKHLIMHSTAVFQETCAQIIFEDSNRLTACRELSIGLTKLFDSAHVAPTTGTAISPTNNYCVYDDGGHSSLYIWSPRHLVDAGRCSFFFSNLLSSVENSCSPSAIVCMPSMTMLQKMSVYRLSRAHTAKLEEFWETNHNSQSLGIDIQSKRSRGNIKSSKGSAGDDVHNAASILSCSCLSDFLNKVCPRKFVQNRTSVMFWLYQSSADTYNPSDSKILISPPLAFPSCGLSRWTHENDILKIATEEAYTYTSMKNTLIETSTWKSSCRYNDTIIEMEVENRLEKLVSFYFEKHPLFLYDAVRSLERVRGGWRGNVEGRWGDSLAGYVPQEYPYFGESDQDEDDDIECDDVDSVVTWRRLLRLKAPYINRVQEQLSILGKSRALSFEQKVSLIKLLCWGGQFFAVFDHLATWALDDDILALNASLHQFCHEALCSPDHDSSEKDELIFDKVRTDHVAVYSAAFQYFVERTDVIRLRSLCCDEPHGAGSMADLAATKFNECKESRADAIKNMTIADFKGS